MAAETSLKKDFFTELFQLDRPDESTEDFPAVLATFRSSRPSRRLSASLRAPSGPRRVHTRRQFQSVERTLSAPLPLACSIRKKDPPNLNRDLKPDIPDTAPSSSPGPEVSATLSRPNLRLGAAEESEQMPPAGKKKRKRSQSLELLPDAQQIFRGLKFYFIPDNDIAPARKLRIRKALERGAIWIKQWDDDNITHVIVDKGLTLEDILKYLKKPAIP
ncbi:MAG: hypothetical protein Q9220_001228, partial [cf. Caloplaca sp. 1 TL-2023]